VSIYPWIIVILSLFNKVRQQDNVRPCMYFPVRKNFESPLRFDEVIITINWENCMYTPVLVISETSLQIALALTDSKPAKFKKNTQN